jgi:lysophospholipase L1-like esterase
MRKAAGLSKEYFLAVSLIALVLVSTGASAQQSTASPAAARTQEAKLLDDPVRTDWPNLKRFHGDDVALPAPAAGEKRVVFMGDSITEAWLHNGVPASQPDPGFFPGKPYVNRGISGQTTPQMLLRFRQDVIQLKPSAVVIFAGTNDIAGNTGDMTPEQTEDNLTSMAELAHANGIRVVLCSILPAFDFSWKRGREPAPKVVALNTWINAYAASHGYVYVDFHSAMVDDRGGLPVTLSKDGVHPNKAGYDIMNPLVEAGIATALSGK